jgi:hypothetical protein
VIVPPAKNATVGLISIVVPTKADALLGPVGGGFVAEDESLSPPQPARPAYFFL